MLAGAIAGLLAFVFARIFAEPLIDQAIAYEGARDAAQAALDKAEGMPAMAEGPEIFSRTIQSTIGIATGMTLFGLAMGALLAVAFVLCRPRYPHLRSRALALLIGLFGFLGIYLVPFMKYPANPPAIGHENTIGDRGNLYLVLVASSVLFLVGATWLARRWNARFGTWNSALLSAGCYIVVMGVIMALLPQLGELSANVATYGRHATETPLPLTNAKGEIVFPGFSADLLYGFRFYSVAAQLIMWLLIGLIFGRLAERVLAEDGSAAERTRVPQRA